jgi:hypothetical protein
MCAAAFLAARDGVQGEWVHIELGDGVALADQPEELPLGGLQGGVRHHVEQADVQFADILRRRPFFGQDDVGAGLAQALQRRQGIVGDQRQGSALLLAGDGGFDQGQEIGLVFHLGHLLRGDGVAVRTGDGFVTRHARMEQAREDPAGEVVGFDLGDEFQTFLAM